MSTPFAVSSISTSTVQSSAPGLSVSDRMFLLQVSRKETADVSLDGAINNMSAKLKDQQDLNKLLASLSGRANDVGNVHLTKDEVDFLKRVGFNCDSSGNFNAPPYLGGEIPASAPGLTRTAMNNDAVSGTNWANRTDNVFIPKEKLDAFKDALTKHIASLSGSNEIQMLQVQRLMNSANEAMQAASSQLKSSHDIAMSIIRNLA